jgi:hypothetical protein
VRNLNCIFPFTEQEKPKPKPGLFSKGTQTDPIGEPRRPGPKTPVSDHILQSDKHAYFFTGLHKMSRQSLWDFLGDAKNELTLFGSNPPKKTSELRGISIECQFILTLTILKRNKTFEELHLDYHLSTDLISQVFKTWLQFLYWKFRDIQEAMFTKRYDIKKPLPKCFQNVLLRNTRVVIDCTEIEIESSTNYDQQSNTYSPYKTGNTIKMLIGVLPSGAACYISDAFEGCISDRAICMKSDFLNFIEPGDVVLADRGFNIHDLIEERGGHLVIPDFLRKRTHLPLDELGHTRVVAKARIHIERYNQRFKLFKFLKGPIPLYHLPILSQAVYVCCCLANFSPILVAD